MSAAGYGSGAGFGASAIAPRPSSQPRRTPGPLIAVALGSGFLVLALLLAMTGVPAKLFFHPKASHSQLSAGSWNVMRSMAVTDANIRYIDQQTGAGAHSYGGHVRAIDAEEAAIPTLAKQLDGVNGSVIGLDRGLTKVRLTTQQLQTDLGAMVVTSKHSGLTMSQLGTQIQTLSGTMGKLNAATLQLSAALGAINVKAHGIAVNGTGRARTITHQLDSSLPATVPKPTTSLQAGDR